MQYLKEGLQLGVLVLLFIPLEAYAKKVLWKKTLKGLEPDYLFDAITKPETAVATQKVLPNSARNFTKVILNFEYTEGTMTLYDLTGRIFSMKS